MTLNEIRNRHHIYSSEGDIELIESTVRVSHDEEKLIGFTVKHRHSCAVPSFTVNYTESFKL